VNVVVGNSATLGLLIRGGSEYGLGIFVAGIDQDSVADRSGIMVRSRNNNSSNHIYRVMSCLLISTTCLFMNELFGTLLKKNNDKSHLVNTNLVTKCHFSTELPEEN